MPIVVLLGSGNWTVPSDWNSLGSIVECVGAGGGGAGNGGGGGGGEYRGVRGFSTSAGSSIPYSCGTAGGGGAAPATAGSNGGDTTFNTSTVVGKGGSGAPNANGGNGGTGGTGTLSANGGGGGTLSTGGAGGGGGGAGGPGGSGSAGSNSSAGPTPGNGGNGGGGLGGAGGTAALGQNGGNSFERIESATGPAAPFGGGGGGRGGTTAALTAGTGGNYGGGGGGGDGSIRAGGNGGPGAIAVSYVSNAERTIYYALGLVAQQAGTLPPVARQAVAVSSVQMTGRGAMVMGSNINAGSQAYFDVFGLNHHVIGRYDADGSPTAPSYSQRRFGLLGPFYVAVDPGDSVEVNVKFSNLIDTTAAERPRMLIRSDDSLGLNDDLAVVAADDDDWQTLTATPSPDLRQAGVLEVYLEMRGHNADASWVLWSNLVRS